MGRCRRVVFLAFEGCQSLDLTGPLEVFTTAERLPAGRYSVKTVAPAGEPFATGSGLSIAGPRGRSLAARGIRVHRSVPARGRRPTSRRCGWSTPAGCSRARAGTDEVARACGFGTVETFRRAFRRRLGVSPGEYRDRVRAAA